MRLADFISGNMEAILIEWDAFAKSLYPQMTRLSLRDHAREILTAIAIDLRTRQTKQEQSEKSMGHAPKALDSAETPAETHAALRAQSGININQLAAEYRALRASVLRLWQEAFDPGLEGLHDMIRFNEAIDQALTESIGIFNAKVDRSRNLLLGMLGHDMRNPLNAIMMVAQELATLNAGATVSEAAESLIRSGASIQALLDDLVDFNRTNLGLGIKITVGEADLAALFADELQQLRAAHASHRIELNVQGDVRGRWDGARLKQVLRNLVSNAIAYGDPEEPIQVKLFGDETEVHFEVTNRGTVIDPNSLQRLFDPLERGGGDSRLSHEEGLGLGLYIVREITEAHGGAVAVRSDSEGTVFSVHLPRYNPSDR